MPKGSIRFDDGANIEVEVDKSAAEGAKLLSAVNLVDGQELGGGGIPITTININASSATGNIAQLMFHPYGTGYIFEGCEQIVAIENANGYAIAAIIEEPTELATMIINWPTPNAIMDDWQPPADNPCIDLFLSNTRDSFNNYLYINVDRSTVEGAADILYESDQDPTSGFIRVYGDCYITLNLTDD